MSWNKNGKNIEEKGKQFDQYFKDNKLYQIESCMSSEVRVMIAFWFPPKSYLQNANECMNSVLKPAGSAKCKSISQTAEKLIIGVKKQENYVILSLLNQGEWTLLQTYRNME